jgi:enoyl-CoA hydratase/carnithine racemase
MLLNSWVYPRYSNALKSIRMLSSMASNDRSLIWEKSGRIVTLSLNRPKALNSLTLDMCTEVCRYLKEWNVGIDDVSAFVVKSSSTRAFCAGGDVKAVWNAARERDRRSLGTGKPGSLETDFFREEYKMNYLLGCSAVPQITLWDGIVMGGGVGISLFGKFRVATEKTVFAMPETAIGIFPDVGGSYWLPFIKPAGAGFFVGLSGCRLGECTNEEPSYNWVDDMLFI